MKRHHFAIALAAGVAALLIVHLSVDGRGGGGRGGGGGGRVGGGGFSGGGRVGGGGFSGGGVVSRPAPARPAISPGGGGPLTGGSISRGTGSTGGKTWTGPGGGSISTDWGGKVISGPGGGKAVVGGKDSSITTPGGKTIDIDSGGIAGKTGGGGAFAGKGGVVSGDRGTIGGKKGAAIGPDGKAIAGKSGFAATDHGLARYSSAAARGYRGTAHVSRGTLVTQRGVVSRSFAHYNCFSPGWWPRYPNAWRAAAWTTAAVLWSACTWGQCASYCGYPEEPVYYDYGTNVVYDEGNVYVDGALNGTDQEYSESSAATAAAGKAAEASEKDDWLPLGVFGMVQADDKDANIVFQLAVNKAGVIRGNYYNALEDNTVPVYGQVDKMYRTASWMVGDKKYPVYEAGFANLTKEATTMMVHFEGGRSQQWNLIRLEQPADGGKEAGK